ncbi:helix-turn-helix domain-containing protein [Staphylococcus equorum]|uniref:Helix-turn-helix domain-containing protein n=1 Tax=Staphylococcus equorum TaxID=246432 RepID=A0A9X4L6Q1_9STAP|nr:helix-turn-helix transcriptional regulator [Staphylococcus equorum]MDG0818824.1 helix-turn-helix domain-containing protein [Staphylococcus equorum]MDG0839465.1 helix-turn-helix domain-containing protein [Staphylococcus equorum]MDG0844809.1 helix-turn-helix domain-containing protein [Staphylococcus equorum]MDK9853872.1 helix-turn-helix transcriptional regulator [Staphylococcus equorum]
MQLSKVGNQVKFIRKQKGLTQESLARKTNQSKQIISNIERGYSIPNYKQIVSLAHALDCTTNDIVRDSEKNMENYQPIMFKDKEAFDNLSIEERQRILDSLEDQADYLIMKAIQKNDGN